MLDRRDAWNGNDSADEFLLAADKALYRTKGKRDGTWPVGRVGSGRCATRSASTSDSSPGTTRRWSGAPRPRAKQRLGVSSWLEARGRTLEIGAGSGFNLPHYTDAVTELVVSEPSPHMREHLRERLEADPPPVGSWELADADAPRACRSRTAASTPSQADSSCARSRIPRWPSPRSPASLKPGGRYIFLEHVHAGEGTMLGRFQDLIEVPHRYIAAGCHPNRRTWELIENSPLDIERLRGASSRRRRRASSQRSSAAPSGLRSRSGAVRGRACGSDLVLALGELFDDLRAERREVVRVAARHQALVDDYFLVHDLAARVADVRADRRIGRQCPSRDEIGLDQRPRARDRSPRRLAGREEVLEELDTSSSWRRLSGFATPPGRIRPS